MSSAKTCRQARYAWHPHTLLLLISGSYCSHCELLKTLQARLIQVLEGIMAGCFAMKLVLTEWLNSRKARKELCHDVKGGFCPRHIGVFRLGVAIRIKFFASALA